MMNKPALYRGLIVLFVVSFAVFIYLMNVGIEERHEMKSDIEHLGELHETNEIENSELKSQVNLLTEENDSLKVEITTIVNDKVKVAAPSGLHKFTVVVYSKTPRVQVIKEIDDYIYSEGYKVSAGVNYFTLPDGMNKNPVVYYHSEESKYLAKKIALDIEGFTGISFSVKKGSSSAGKPKSIFIHYSKL